MKDAIFNFLVRYRYKLIFILTMLFVLISMFRLLGNWPLNNISNKMKTPVLIFTQWGTQPKEETLLSLIEEFQSANSGIKITLKTVSYEDFKRELFEGGETSLMGDIFALDPLWVPELFDMQIIENSYIPLIFFANIFYYNIDILREAGFSRPPKTRGEFLSCARTVAGREAGASIKPAGLALGLNSSRGIYDDIFPWIWSAGTQLVKDGKPALASAPLIESLSFLAALNSEGLIVPGAFSADAEKKLEDFLSGGAAFVIAPSSAIKRIREHLGDEAFGVTSIPTPDNYAGKSFFGTSAWTASVYSGSAHKEEARLFVDFLAEKASFLSEEAMPGNGVPPAYDAFYSKVWDIVIAAEPAADFSDLPWTKLEKAFKEELLILFEGKSSAAETASAIQKKWEAILENSNE